MIDLHFFSDYCGWRSAQHLYVLELYGLFKHGTSGKTIQSLQRCLTQVTLIHQLLIKGQLEYISA